MSTNLIVAFVHAIKYGKYRAILDELIKHVTPETSYPPKVCIYPEHLPASYELTLIWTILVFMFGDYIGTEAEKGFVIQRDEANEFLTLLRELSTDYDELDTFYFTLQRDKFMAKFISRYCK